MSVFVDEIPWLGADDLAANPLSLEAFGPGTRRPWVAIDGRNDRVRDLFSQAAWLASLPCPVVLLSGNAGLRPANCDAVVERAQSLLAIGQSVAAAPRAAMIFVQVMRLMQSLPPEEALTVESLAYATLQSGLEFRRWLQTPRLLTQGGDEPGPAVLLESVGETLSVVLNRPANRNAISTEMRDALVAALTLGSLDAATVTVTLRGMGKCFSVGGDLQEFGRSSDPASAHWVRTLRSPARAALHCGPKLHAYVHGACIGAGIEIPAFAAHITAAANSYFQLPELRMGLLPGSGGCVSLGRRIGRHRTALLFLTGRRIGAHTAKGYGLVDEIVD